MKIRKASLKDIRECLSFSRLKEFSFIYKMSKKESFEYISRFINKGIFLVAEENASIVGFITGELMVGSFVWIDIISVRPKMRGKGVGKLLINEFSRIVRKKKGNHLHLIAPKFNPSTLKFYKSMGFVKGKEFIEFSKDL